MKTIKLFIGTILSFVSLGQGYSGGSGTLVDPYLISNKSDLKYLSENSVEWSKNFLQVTDIYFTSVDFSSGGEFYNNNKGFIPIGNSTISFTGSYDGGGYVIDSLYCNRPSESNVGFLGYANHSGEFVISNLGITNSYVSGLQRVGLLVGMNYLGMVVNCFATGEVEGDYYVGGLVGTNGSSIQSSYAFVSVSGIEEVGGLVGRNGGQLKNSYTHGDVFGASDIGGLIGRNYGNPRNNYSTCFVSGFNYVGGVAGSNVGIILNTYWDVETSGQPTAGAGYGSTTGTYGRTTIEMKTESNFTEGSWDFDGETANGMEDFWTMFVCGVENEGYPVLSWQKPFSGLGTVSSPYLISDKMDLKTLSENNCLWDKNYIQLRNINFSANDFESNSDFYNSGNGFIPIGSSIYPFEGSYEGNGNAIYGLEINRSSQDFIGFFGATSAASISNLGLIDCIISGRSNTGALIGFVENSSSILNCFTTGIVTGDLNNAGGLAGVNNNSTISDSYSLVEVSGVDYVGGLVGANGGNSIIINSYSTGSVSGVSNNGGLAGFNATPSSIITNSFWDTETSNLTTSSGGVGKTTLEMKNQNTFSGASWDFGTPIWQMNCGTNDGYPVLFYQSLSSAPVISGVMSLTNVMCNGGSDGAIDLTANGGTGPYTFLWNTNDTSEDLLGVIAGVYSVTIIDANGCMGTIAETITEPGIVAGDTTVIACGVFEWYGNTYTSSGTPTHTIANGSSSGCDSIVTLNLTINPQPSAGISANGNTITADQTGAIYQWIDCGNNNAEIAGEMGQSFIATVNGSYAVVVTENSCSSTSECVEIETNDLDDISNNDLFKVYPNPASNIFTIEISNWENSDLIIYNALGSAVLKQKLYKSSNVIDVHSIPKGVYTVCVHISDSEQIKRVVIQ